ncbi:MAG: HEAT repeat domain-containing protein [Nostochopsis sp.]
MSASSEFQHYLQSICSFCDYTKWWTRSALTHTEREQLEPFDFDLQVKEVKPQQSRGTSSENPSNPTSPLPVIEALHQYVADTKHVLLVGRPGAGKTKTLIRYLLKQAKKALTDELAKIPVLIELKTYKASTDNESGILHLIKQEFEESCDLSLTLTDLKQYLFTDRRFILLIDGLNELTSNEAIADLNKFRDRCRKKQIPIVLTTRGLGYRDLDIETKLEIQPISPADRRRFIEERVSAGDQQKLQAWMNRAQQADYTPFVMWMLAEICQQVNSSSQLESFSLGEAFREFVRLYQDKLYEQGRLSDEDCEKWSSKLEDLASEMITDERPENFVISRKTASEILGSEALLNNLIRHHLLVERRGNIEFCHQLLQEYYVAESLRRKLPDFLKDENSDKRFQHHYLNYLKWTEPIAIMLGLPEITETQAKKLIELALDVDLMLGARFAGEVIQVCQSQAIELVVGLNTPSLLKAKLLGITRSEYAIATLLKLLKDQEPDLREKAAEALGEIGNETPVPALMNTLDDQIFTVRWATVTALGKIGSKTVISGLNKALDDQAYFVRLATISALGLIGSEAAISILLKALEHQDWGVRLKAAYELAKLGHETGFSALLKALNESEFNIWIKAISALELLNSERSVLSLVHAVEHPNPSVCVKAIEALGRIGSDAAIPILQKLLNSKTSEITEEVIRTLGQIGSQVAITVLFKISTHYDDFIRRNAIEILGQLGNKSAIPILLKSLEDENSTVRSRAAIALGRIGEEVTVPNLLKTLADTDIDVCCSAARALGQIRSEAAISALVQTLKNNEDFSVRLSVAEALGQIGGEAAILELQQTLKHPNVSICESAARALGLIGNTKAIPALIEALDNSDCKTLESLDCYYSLEIAIALSRLGSEVGISVLIKTLEHPCPSSLFFIWNQLEVEAAIPVLMKALEHQELEIYIGAASALDKIQRKSEKFSETLIPMLHRSLENPNPLVCIKAISVLEKVDSKEVISTLLPILTHENVEVRFHAARVLARLGKEEAISVLVKALEEGDHLTQSDAANALAALGTETAISGLFSPLENENFKAHTIIVEALEKIGNSKALPKLFQLQVNCPNDNIGNAIDAIQSRCQFYNYNIAQSPPPETQNINMSEASKYNFPRAEKVQIFEQVGTYIENNYPKDEILKQQITELRQLVHQLQQTHQPSNEAEALEIIDVEFRVIQETNLTLWQKIRKQLQLVKRQLLKPERHLTASKAAIAEVAKHYLEDSVFAKALITYVDTMSADIDQGE